MACRITRVTFHRIAVAEAEALGLGSVGYYEKPDDTAAIGGEMDGFHMIHIEEPGPTAILHRKPIQSLVDEPEQARPIIRNLLRWAKEHGAK